MAYVEIVNTPIWTIKFNPSSNFFFVDLKKDDIPLDKWMGFISIIIDKHDDIFENCPEVKLWNAFWLAWAGMKSADQWPEMTWANKIEQVSGKLVQKNEGFAIIVPKLGDNMTTSYEVEDEDNDDNDDDYTDSNNPIANLVQALEEGENMQTVHPVVHPHNWDKGHQTLVVVDVRENAPGTFVERATRFVTSLNLTTTIKADIMSVSDGNFYSGLVWTGKIPGGVSDSTLEDFARDREYAQITRIKYTGAGSKDYYVGS